jgi:membrane protease YdiL (CAAX protease family)
MNFKRLLLLGLTIVALIPILFSLLASLNQPQVQANLQLYETNLVLQVTEFNPDILTDTDNTLNSQLAEFRDVLLGKDPYLNAQKQYQEALGASQKNLDLLEKQLDKLSISLLKKDVDKSPNFSSPQITNSSEIQQLKKQMDAEKEIIAETTLKLGIIQAHRGKVETAITAWKNLLTSLKAQENSTPLIKLSQVLIELWQPSPQLSSEPGSLIAKNLQGWFRYRTLKQLYQVQKNQPQLSILQQQEQAIAQEAIYKLLLIGTLPVLGGIVGVGLFLFLLVQFFVRGDRALLSINKTLAWETPWNVETIWQVLIAGFFFVGQVALPLLFSFVGYNAANLNLRGQAIYVLVSYVSMAISGLLILYLSLKPFFPLPKDWFKFKPLSNWILWGIGGYLVALPLVLVVSLINQEFWDGQGGSNPLLFLALKAQDTFVLTIFFITASVAAPIFEEIMFRGFLLPSLTRYMPLWGAIVASSFVFAFAHLSLSEILPLTTLGMVLGFVYTRSRNLLASMLLHSLWNSGTLVSLFLLGSGAG